VEAGGSRGCDMDVVATKILPSNAGSFSNDAMPSVLSTFSTSCSARTRGVYAVGVRESDVAVHVIRMDGYRRGLRATSTA